MTEKEIYVVLADIPGKDTLVLEQRTRKLELVRKYTYPRNRQ